MSEHSHTHLLLLLIHNSQPTRAASPKGGSNTHTHTHTHTYTHAHTHKEKKNYRKPLLCVNYTPPSPHSPLSHTHLSSCSNCTHTHTPLFMIHHIVLYCTYTQIHKKHTQKTTHTTFYSVIYTHS